MWLSKLRIQLCHCYMLGLCCGMGSVPESGTSACLEVWQKKKKKHIYSFFFPTCNQPSEFHLFYIGCCSFQFKDYSNFMEKAEAETELRCFYFVPFIYHCYTNFPTYKMPELGIEKGLLQGHTRRLVFVPGKPGTPQRVSTKHF